MLVVSIVGAIGLTSIRPGIATEALLMPTPPKWELFYDDCKRGEDATYTCYFHKIGRQLFGKPADASGNTRHIAFSVIKSDVPSKAEILVQTIYNCKTGISYQKFVAGRLDYGNGNGWEVATPQSEWKAVSSSVLKKDFMPEFCPSRAGYQRVGGLQIDTKNIISNGGIVNIRGFNEKSEKEYVLSIDCKSLLFGVNSKPSRPISPRSIGEDMYNKFCRARN